MPDPPPNSPIGIRAFMLYDAYQRISAEKSYKNYEKLCEAVGNEAISTEKYESLYNQYIEEDERSRGLPIPDIRGCILSDVINGKTAEKSFDDLCDAFKNHKIDKEDHDYWFKRFHNGHLSQVSFSDFPEDVLAEIVEKSDIKSYLNLRNVSHALRTVIDQLRPPCSDIRMHCGEELLYVYLNNELIAEYYETTKSQLTSGLIRKRSLKTLEVLLSNPKLRLKYFEFFPESYNGIGTPPLNYKELFFNLLNSLDHKIHAEKCMIMMDYENEVIKVLQCFKPGTLKELEISTGFSTDRNNEVVKMDQWKLAKHMEIRTYELPPIENFFHFSTFELRHSPISMEDMVKLCENASYSNTFEYCKVDIQGIFELETIKSALNLQPTSSPDIYLIPNTNLVIQFDRWNSNRLKIYRN